jgi:hypothetical protein
MDQDHSPLYERLCSFENLLRSYRDAARGKHARPDVAAFDYDLEGHLLRLRRQLLAGSWRPHAYRRFTLADPKPRVISAAPVSEQMFRVKHRETFTVRQPASHVIGC